MSCSEFRWNKKRKHYVYLHADDGFKRLNILITSKPFVLRKGNVVMVNVPLYRHPNPNKEGQFYFIPRNYADNCDSFDEKEYKDWVFDKNDKRKVKRIKKNKYHK